MLEYFMKKQFNIFFCFSSMKNIVICKIIFVADKFKTNAMVIKNENETR